MKRTGSVVVVVAALVVWLVVGCTPSARKDRLPEVALPAMFSFDGESDYPDRWWVRLGDDKLSELVERALRENPSLAAVRARLQQAQAAALRARAGLLPSASASVGYRRSEGNGAYTIPQPSVNVAAFDAEGRLTYTLDLWRRAVDEQRSAGLAAFAAAEDVRAAAVLLSSSVGKAWYGLIEGEIRLGWLGKRVSAMRKLVAYSERAYRDGRLSFSVLLARRSALRSTEEALSEAKAGLLVMKHRLAVLCGDATLEVKVSKNIDFPSLPPLPRVGIPVDVLNARPDVRAAGLRVFSAAAAVGAARAARLPVFGVGFSVSSSAGKVSDLLDGWERVLLSSISQVLFDGGARRAEVDRAKALLSEAAARYREVLLKSLQEVEDLVAKENSLRERLELIGKRLEYARHSLVLARRAFEGGRLGFDDYLRTLLDYYALEDAHAACKGELLVTRIDLVCAVCTGRFGIVPGGNR